MGMSTGASGSAMSEINVTPLVDVMLVLLIIFMVAAPLIEQERAEQELQENRDRQQRLIALNLPVLADEPPPPTDQDDVKTVTVRVTRNLDIAVGEQPVTRCANATDKKAWVPCFDKLQGALIDNAAARQFGVSVDADPTVPFGFVVGVMHRANLAGITKVGMMPRETAEAP